MEHVGTAKMEESLIIEVEKRAVLYDKRLTAYKNSNTREDAWKEVSRELKLGTWVNLHILLCIQIEFKLDFIYLDNICDEHVKITLFDVFILPRYFPCR